MNKRTTKILTGIFIALLILMMVIIYSLPGISYF